MSYTYTQDMKAIPQFQKGKLIKTYFLNMHNQFTIFRIPTVNSLFVDNHINTQFTPCIKKLIEFYESI